MYVAGDVLYIEAGEWICLRAVEVSMTFHFEGTTILGGLKALYNICQLWQEHHEENERASSMFHEGKYVLPQPWTDLIIAATEKYPLDKPFTFQTHTHGGTNAKDWVLAEDYTSTAAEESIKGQYMLLLGRIGATLGGEEGEADKLLLTNISAKEAGRIVNWCKAHIGLSATAKSMKRRAQRAKEAARKKQLAERQKRRQAGEGSSSKRAKR